MILATRSGNRELRFGEAMARIPSPMQIYGSAAGVPVTLDTATGIAAIGRAIRLVSGIGAVMPIRVFQGRRGDRRERPETTQARLLDEPMFGLSDFDWRWDVTSSLEVCENAFLFKRKADGQVVELEFIPHWAMTAEIDRQSGRKKFTVSAADGRKVYSESQVLHIRGQTIGGGPFGVSRIHQHRDALGAMLAAQKFEGKYFSNDARPQTAYVFPQQVPRHVAQEWKQDIEADFGGENYGRPMVIGGGATIQTFPLNLEDAQFVEVKQVSVEEAGRIMDVDPVLLGAQGDRKAALEHFLKVQLPPRLQRITRALRADPDLNWGVLYPEHEVNELMYADALTRAQVQHYRVQDGTELVDEARADNGRGPLPPVPADPAQEPGKVPQLTPVGGAPALPLPAATEE